MRRRSQSNSGFGRFSWHPTMLRSAGSDIKVKQSCYDMPTSRLR
jgi:hypothetical protein